METVEGTLHLLQTREESGFGQEGLEACIHLRRRLLCGWGMSLDGFGSRQTSARWEEAFSAGTHQGAEAPSGGGER